MKSLFSLTLKKNILKLFISNEIKFKSIYVDFLSKRLIKRTKFNLLNKELIIKSLGIKHNNYPYVIDVTAGLGNDAYLMACIGCKVLMIEKNPMLFLLVYNALERLRNNKNINFSLKKRLNIIYASSIEILKKIKNKPDIIYIDPMFPKNKKTALVKKKSIILRKLVNNLDDSYKLLQLAKKISKKRTIVKRPNYASYLDDTSVDFSIKNKKYRFDIYLSKNNI